MNKNKKVIMAISCVSVMIASIMSISANEKVNNYKISKDMEMHTAEGEEIIVYEQPIDDSQVPTSVENTKLVPVSQRELKVSNDVEMHTAEGEEIVVYEMSIEEYEATDFRQK